MAVSASNSPDPADRITARIVPLLKRLLRWNISNRPIRQLRHNRATKRRRLLNRQPQLDKNFPRQSHPRHIVPQRNHLHIHLPRFPLPPPHQSP